MMELEGLKASHLLAAFVERRVLPLQARPHIISNMSGCRDPSPMSTKVMTDVEVVRMVNFFSDCKLSEKERQFGKPPYRRANLPPSVSLLILYIFDGPGSSCRLRSWPWCSASRSKQPPTHWPHVTSTWRTGR